MNHSNQDYNNALLETEKLYEHYTKQGKEPVGLSPFDSSSLSDSLTVKQNNTIIILLIKILEKLDIILGKSHTIQHIQITKDLEDITNKLSNINLGAKPVRRTLVKPPPWQFFQVDPAPSQNQQVQPQ